MSEATFEQANLQLKLYDLRREPRLREAREWFSNHFHPEKNKYYIHHIRHLQVSKNLSSSAVNIVNSVIQEA